MSLTAPRFSVVVPSRDRPDQLAACLASLTRLSYDPERFELIVVDDGSAVPLAGTISLPRAAPRLTVLRQSNAGPAAARNLGVSAASGELIAFIDDDASAEPGWLGAFDRAAADQPRALLGGLTRNALPANPYSSTSQLILELAYGHHNSGPGGPAFFASNNLCLARAGFERIGGFDARFRTAEDRELCDRWRAGGGPLASVEDAVVSHAHPLGLREFWGQHLAYGRGAFAYHRSRRERASGEVFESSFYVTVARELGAALRHAQMRRALALVAWQTANVCGFSLEALRSGLSRRPAPPARGANQ